MERYPTINGQKTIGLSLLSDTWQWYISVSDPSGLLVGHPHDGVWAVNQQTLETTYKFLVPEIQLWYRWLNRMNADGVLDPESFTQREDVWHAKIASGRVLGLAYPLWGYSTARSSLISDGMPERTYAYLPIVADERFTNQSLKDYGIGGGHGISITSSNRDPERAFEFLDWLCTEESNILRHFGIEGINYHVIDGKRVVPEEEFRLTQSDPNYARRTGIGQWINAFPLFGNAYVDSTGNPITRKTPETIKQGYLDVERETLSAYGAEMWIDLFPSTGSLGVSRYSQAWQHALPQDLNAIVAEADIYMKTALANIVLGKPEDFDASWQKIQNDLRAMKIEEANRAMTSLIRDKVALWNR
jgi:putative aldouronate transport system substrate-binding protein